MPRPCRPMLPLKVLFGHGQRAAVADPAAEVAAERVLSVTVSVPSL